MIYITPAQRKIYIWCLILLIISVAVVRLVYYPYRQQQRNLSRQIIEAKQQLFEYRQLASTNQDLLEITEQFKTDLKRIQEGVFKHEDEVISFFSSLARENQLNIIRLKAESRNVSSGDVDSLLVDMAFSGEFYSVVGFFQALYQGYQELIVVETVNMETSQQEKTSIRVKLRLKVFLFS